MKILFFECEPWQEKIIRASLPNDEIFFFAQPLTASSIPNEHRDAEIISIFLCSCITQAVIDAFANLKLIAARSTGYDRIAIDQAEKKGITISYAPQYAHISVAEYTVALIFNLARRITAACHRTADEHSFSRQGLRGFDLRNKTLGVIGTGNIGSAVIQIAHCIGMKTIAHDHCTNDDLVEKYGTIYLPLEELLSQSDIISLHVPLTQETHHMINKKNISSIKKGAYLINTARGAIVQTDALIEALNKNILAGAALDVLEEECFTYDPLNTLEKIDPASDKCKTVLENMLLLNHPHVLITPHNAFNSQDALERLIQTTIDSINAFRNGAPINTI